MVEEGAVLRGVEHLEQGARRVALVPASWLGLGLGLGFGFGFGLGLGFGLGFGFGLGVRARVSKPSLSISSMSTTGLETPTLLKAWMSLPGIAPT